MFLLVAGALTGCGGGSGNGGSSGDTGGSDSESGGTKQIAFVCIDMQGAFWVDMMRGGEVAADDYGVDIVFKSGEGSLEKQISLIENLVLEGVDCIIVDPLDKEGIKPAIEKAGEAGIPVITAGNEIDTDYNVCTIYNDAYDVGCITDIMAKAIDESGKVACVVGAPGSAVSDARQRGFEDRVAEYSNIEPFVLPAKWDATVAQQMVTDLLTAEPDLKGVICADAVGFQIVQAAQTSGHPDVLVTNFAGMVDNIPGVQDGTYLCDLLMGGARIGYWNVATAAQLANGIEIPSKIYLPTSVILSDEMLAKVEEWGLGGEMDTCTTDEALEILEGFSGEFGPDAYDVDAYKPRS
jgi:ribose transport system substrate-binding protein